MSFAILGLAVPGMEIEGEGCVGKSFPGFWAALEGLREARDSDSARHLTPAAGE